MKKLISKLFFIAVLALTSSAAHAQSTDFLWAFQAGGGGVDRGNSIAADGSGNSFATGTFVGAVNFGNTTLTSSAGSFDIFIANYDGDGNVLWAARAGGTDPDEGLGIATDGSGNIIITGFFIGVATFSGDTLTSAGSGDVFIVKYDANGNMLWAAQAGGAGFDQGSSISADSADNIIVTGSFSETATFGNTTLTSAGSRDFFIAQYDADGNAIRAARAGGTDFDQGNGVAADGAGNSFVAGVFNGTATFGNTTLTSAGSQDIFIAKYDANGNALWAAQAGGTGLDQGNGIVADGSGNAIAAGAFNGAAAFGDTTFNSSVTDDMFIAKYDGDGNFLWAVQAGGPTGADFAKGVAMDDAGNSLVAGAFSGTAAFGDTTLTSAGIIDVFIARYDGDGNFLRAARAGGTGLDRANGIAAAGAGKAIATGDFRSTATFGNITLTSANSNSDMFVAKLAFSTVTGIEEKFTLPRSFNLSQNYPNPFNPATTIVFTLPKASAVTLELFDVRGRVVATLVDENLTAGQHKVVFDASGLTSGVYFYRMRAKNFQAIRKLSLIK